MTMTFRAGLAGLALLAAAASPAFAQQPPQPSPEQVKAAREVIEISGAAGGLSNIVPIFFDEAKQTFTRTRPEIAKDLDEVLKALQPEFEQRREALMTEIATVYAQQFSAAELAEIRGFYQTPTGKKLVQSLPGVMQASYEKTQAWSQKMSQDIVTRARQELKKRGQDL